MKLQTEESRQLPSSLFAVSKGGDNYLLSPFFILSISSLSFTSLLNVKLVSTSLLDVKLFIWNTCYTKTSHTCMLI